MPNEVGMIYWDSCVVIAYLAKTPEYYATLDKILEDVGNSSGQQKIVTSLVTKIEVAYVGEQDAQIKLGDEELARIDDFWLDSSVVSVVELHEEVALLARKLIRQGLPLGWKLKRFDSVHLATAKWLGVTEFQTYDLDHLQRYEDKMGFPIRAPYVLQERLIDAPKRHTPTNPEKKS